MRKTMISVLLLAFAGCCSYSDLKTDCGSVKVDGRDVRATYEVLNQNYELFGVLPITTGTTWKNGPYEMYGSVDWFGGGKCSLDDNLESVKHACETVGGGTLANVVGRVDVYRAWSLFLVKKTVVKTSCVILK